MSETSGDREKEVIAYREVLKDEIRAHRTFSRISTITGFGLLAGGVFVLNYYAPLAWLLAIVGLMRGLNSFYDLQREDRLKKRLRQLEERFGTHEQP